MKERTGRIENAQVTKQWDFPETSPARLITKHFINLSFTLHRDPHALLSFLIYQSNQDNTIKYSNRLLDQFKTAVLLAQEKYGEKKVSKSQPVARRNFKTLINLGLLLPTQEKKIFLINPNLTYSKNVNPTFYKEWKKKNNIQEYIDHCQLFLKAHRKAQKKYQEG